MTDDLTTRLLEAIELREQHAKKDIWAADQASSGDWRPRYGVNLGSSWVETESSPIARLDGPEHEADALLVGRFRPKNVRERAEHMLRLCQAHREIVEEYRWAKQSLLDAQEARAPEHMLVLERTREKVMLWTLRKFASAYGLDTPREEP